MLYPSATSPIIQITYRDFCFEGSCELCQCVVVETAQELGPKAQPGEACCLCCQCWDSPLDHEADQSHNCAHCSGQQELVRSCLTAVMQHSSGKLHVQVLSEESVWGDMVV